MSDIAKSQMVSLLRDYGISDPLVLKAMQKVQRHLFVPLEYQHRAYEDSALPIYYGQTISQPYIVAFMTEQAELDQGMKVLEIGTGSGYQAAILGEICKEVYSIEVVEELANSAQQLLKKLGYRNVHVRCDDGNVGWSDKGPFDRILVTAAAKHVPGTLVDQLYVGGVMIMPLEDEYGQQSLIKLTRTSKKYKLEKLCDVAFVPFVI